MAEVIQRSFTKGELSPSLYARADLRLYATGAKTLRNFFVHPEGGASTRAGFEFIGPIKSNQDIFRLIPFAFNTEQTYVLEFTDLAMRVIKDGGYVLDSTATVTGITNDSPPVVTTSAAHGWSNGDEVYIDGVVGMEEINKGWYTVASATSTTFELSGVNSSLYGTYTSGGTAGRVYSIVSPYPEAKLADLQYTQSADVMTFVHPDYDPRELSRTGHSAWSFAVISYAPTLSAPTIGSVTHGGTGCGTYTKNYSYVVTAINADGEESLPSAAVTSGAVTSLSQTCFNQIQWSSVSGAVSYNVYKAFSENSSVFGWIGKSNTLLYRDYNVAPTAEDAPPEAKTPFTGTGNPPSTVNYYQQRILFGASNNNPQTVWASQSGNYHSMRVSSPTKDDDAITFTIASQKVNEIRHLVALDALIILTSGGEWKVTEGLDDVLTPSTVGVRPQSYFGASKVKPAVIGSSAVYIQERGSRVRDIAYTWESDTYTGSDLSILAQHLFDGYNITDMAYAQEPYSQVYLVRSDGTLLCCTLHKEHEVNAWYTIDTPDASVESIAVVSEDDHDVLYIGVERTINGSPQRFVERLKPRDWTVAEDAFCVDAGVTYEGTAATTIGGLRHLEGEEVVALADGNAVYSLTVSDGQVTIPDAAAKVHVGLAYTCDFETLPVDTNDAPMPLRGKKKSIPSVTLVFKDTRGGYVGPDESNLTEIKLRYDADNYDPLSLRSHDVEVAMQAGWKDEGVIFYRQSDPLPSTILAVVPEVEIG